MMVSFARQHGTERGNYLCRNGKDGESAFLGATPGKGMATVCIICGDRGFDEALIYCDDCKKYAIHRYCLEIVTFDGGLWFCEDCQPEIRNLDTNGEGCTPMRGNKKRRTKKLKWTRVKKGKKKKMRNP